MNYIVSEIVKARINGAVEECEILDIISGGAYVYVFSTGKRKNISSIDIIDERTARRSATRRQILADQARRS